MSSFRCIICLDTIGSATNSMPMSSGHIYCTACATSHFTAQPSCAICRMPQTLNKMIRLYPDWETDQTGSIGSPPTSSSDGSPSTTSMLAGTGNPETGGRQCRAEAMYNYTASPDDPHEISFVKGEVLDVYDKNGVWWQARKQDGSVGSAHPNAIGCSGLFSYFGDMCLVVPSNYMIEVTEGSTRTRTAHPSRADESGSTGSRAGKAKALYNYTESSDDPNEISFAQGEIFDIIDEHGRWWQARKEDGTTGIVPSNYLQKL